jgi:hypothetical protein
VDCICQVPNLISYQQTLHHQKFTDKRVGLYLKNLKI